jgi:hypothetical protein
MSQEETKKTKCWHAVGLSLLSLSLHHLNYNFYLPLFLCFFELKTTNFIMEERWLSPPRMEKNSVFALALKTCGMQSRQQQKQELIRLMRLGLVTFISLSLQEASLASKLQLRFYCTGDVSLARLAFAIEWWRSHKSKINYLASLEKRHGFSKNKQAKKKLCDRIDTLKREGDAFIASHQNIKRKVTAASLPTYSPLHNLLNSKNIPVAMIDFCPAASGIPSLPDSNKWHCASCTGENTGANGNCMHCSITPSRHCKSTPKTYYVLPTDEEVSNDSGDHDSDASYASSDEEDICLFKTNADTIDKWCGMAQEPAKFLIALHPKNPQASFLHMKKTFDISYMKKTITEAYCIEKPSRVGKAQIFSGTNFHNRYHFGANENAKAEIAKRITALKEITNDKDYISEDYIVFNQNNQPAVPVKEIANGLGIDINFCGTTTSIFLLCQAQAMLEDIMHNHANELSQMSSFDKLRGTLSAEEGFSGNNAQAWRHSSGEVLCGIINGVVKKTMTSKLKLKIAVLMYLVYHTPIKRQLGNTDRDSVQRRIVQGPFIKWLGICPTEDTLIAEAFSIHLGFRPPGHFDCCNDARTGHHNRINYIAELFEKFHDCSRNVTLKNPFGTVLYYSRMVVGTFEDRMIGRPDVERDSLLGSILASFNDKSARDVDLLDEKESNACLMTELQNKKHKDQTKDFSGYFATRDEAITRDVFLGTIQHLYVALVLNYDMTYLHATQFAAFVGRECNGTQLLTEVVSNMLRNREKTIDVLKQPSNQCLYIYLTSTAREIVQRSTDQRSETKLSSTDPRFRKMTNSLYQGPGDESKINQYMDFYLRQMENIRNQHPNSKEEHAACDRIQDFTQIKHMRGNICIQTSARLGILREGLDEYASLGGGGCASCIKFHCEDLYGGTMLKADLKQEIERAKKDLEKHGIFADDAMLDQICCRWWRTHHTSLKPDIYFWNKWNDTLQLFYRRRKSKHRSKLEVFVNGAWQPLHNALVPFYNKMIHPNTRQKVNEGPTHWIVAWKEHYKTKIPPTNESN